jgi:hypothetical protein
VEQQHLRHRRARLQSWARCPPLLVGAGLHAPQVPLAGWPGSAPRAKRQGAVTRTSPVGADNDTRPGHGSLTTTTRSCLIDVDGPAVALIGGSRPRLRQQRLRSRRSPTVLNASPTGKCSKSCSQSAPTRNHQRLRGPFHEPRSTES